MLLNKEADRID